MTDPSTTRLEIRPPAPFDFVAAACSHGWAVLAPTTWDAERQRLGRVERLDSGRVVALSVAGTSDAGQPIIAIDVRHAGPLPPADAEEIRRKVGHMLRVDEEFTEFYALCAARGDRWAEIGRGMGRLLRSPTVFEDVVKTIATTNTQWSGTKAMTRALVDALGEPLPHDPTHHAFPTPEAVAAAPLETLSAARFGYRAPYIQALARRVAAGELHLEGLTHSELPTPE